MKVIVTGAAGAVGTRVTRRLALDHEALDVVGFDKAPQQATESTDVKQIDLATADLGSAFSGADVVVHLATAVRPGAIDSAADELELAILGRVLDGCADAAVAQVVVLSSAMVYGAWVGNPVPISEEAAVRPNPDFGWAVLRAAVEQTALEWGQSHDAAVCVLRPTAIVTSDELGQLARVLHAARIGVAAEGDPPVQYLHVDDLASAVSTVVAARFDGVANVAPDSWIPPDQLHDLEGPTARVRVPDWAARALASLRWRAGLAPIPPGVVPYTSHSWVVANDRLRSLGWEPEYTNEEAWVVSHEPGPFDRLPARRQQELALGVMAVILLATAIGVVFGVRRMRRAARAHGHGPESDLPNST